MNPSNKIAFSNLEEDASRIFEIVKQKVWENKNINLMNDLQDNLKVFEQTELY